MFYLHPSSFEDNGSFYGIMILTFPVGNNFLCCDDGIGKAAL